jgi:hypothetical protein
MAANRREVISGLGAARVNRAILGVSPAIRRFAVEMSALATLGDNWDPLRPGELFGTKDHGNAVIEVQGSKKL